VFVSLARQAQFLLMKRIAVLLVLAALFVGGCAAFYLWAVLIGSVMGDAFVAVGGVIYDEQRSPIVGATVMLTSAPKFGLHGQTTSNADGKFSVGLTFGGGAVRSVYQTGFILRVEKEGFIPVERRIVKDEELTIVLLRKAEIPWLLKRVPDTAPHGIPR
jgi:hypothetical protein